MSAPWRLALGCAALAGQVAWVLAGVAPRAWAPFHEHAVYRLTVEIEGRQLATKEALERYRLPAWHFAAERDENWETNDLRFVTDVITAAEAKAESPVRVQLDARVNGEPRRSWSLER